MKHRRACQLLRRRAFLLLVPRRAIRGDRNHLCRLPGFPRPELLAVLGVELLDRCAPVRGNSGESGERRRPLPYHGEVSEAGSLFAILNFIVSSVGCQPSYEATENPQLLESAPMPFDRRDILKETSVFPYQSHA